MELSLERPGVGAVYRSHGTKSGQPDVARTVLLGSTLPGRVRTARLWFERWKAVSHPLLPARRGGTPTIVR